jgi:hypothetical protein
MKNDGIERWPGTDIRKSLDNAFTLGCGNRPHGFTGGPASATVVKLVTRKPGGFAKNAGTIAGLGIRPHAMTVKKIRA